MIMVSVKIYAFYLIVAIKWMTMGIFAQIGLIVRVHVSVVEKNKHNKTVFLLLLVYVYCWTCHK